MDTRKCKSCGHEFQEWVEFCPNCSEPMEDYSRPAGFWIRFGASFIDWLIFIPLGMLSMWNTYSLKSMLVLILTSLPGLIYKPFMESYLFYSSTIYKDLFELLNHHGGYIRAINTKFDRSIIYNNADECTTIDLHH